MLERASMRVADGQAHLRSNILRLMQLMHCPYHCDPLGARNDPIYLNSSACYLSYFF